MENKKAQQEHDRRKQAKRRAKHANRQNGSEAGKAQRLRASILRDHPELANDELAIWNAIMKKMGHGVIGKPQYGPRYARAI
jgi:hypothetical protein